MCAIWQEYNINLRETAIYPHTPNMSVRWMRLRYAGEKLELHILMELFSSSSVKTFLKRIIAPNSLLPLTVVLKNKTDFL